MEFPESVASGKLAADLSPVIEGLFLLIRSLPTAYPMSRTSSATLAGLESHGPCRLTALATRERVTQPAMTQLIGKLEDAGLVRRDADPADGRVVQVSITDAGRAVLATQRAERAEHLGALLAQLSPERRQLLAAALPALSELAETGEGPAAPAGLRRRVGRPRPATCDYDLGNVEPLIFHDSRLRALET